MTQWSMYWVYWLLFGTKLTTLGYPIVIDYLIQLLELKLKRVLSFNVTHTQATGYSRRQMCNLRVDVSPASVRVQFLYGDSYASVTFRWVAVGFLQSILPVQLDRVMRHFADDRWWRPLGSCNKPQYVPLAHTIRVCCALLIKYAHYWYEFWYNEEGDHSTKLPSMYYATCENGVSRVGTWERMGLNNKHLNWSLTSRNYLFRKLWWYSGWNWDTDLGSSKINIHR